MANINIDDYMSQFSISGISVICSISGTMTATGINNLKFSFYCESSGSSLSSDTDVRLKIQGRCNDKFDFTVDTGDTTIGELSYCDLETQPTNLSISTYFSPPDIYIDYTATLIYWMNGQQTSVEADTLRCYSVPAYAGTIEEGPKITIVNNGDNTFKIVTDSYGVGGDNNPIDKSKFTIYWGTYGRYDNLYTGGNIPITEDTYISAAATTYGELGDSLSHLTDLEMAYIAPYVKINALSSNSYIEGTLYALYNKGDGLKYYPVTDLYKNENQNYEKIK